MYFYRVKINSMPQIRFACSSSTDKYKNIIQKRQKMIEISTIDGVGVYIEIDNQKIYVPPKSVMVSLPDVECKIYAADEGQVYDDSIAVYIEDFEYQRMDTENAVGSLEDNTYIDENIVLLPYVFSPGDEFLNVTRLMRTFISYYTQNNASSHFRCLSLWFELLATLNNMCRDYIIGDNDALFMPSSHMYIRKAKKYITTHCCERIKISDIARELHISPNYLSNMFKMVTGKTVLDFINMTRIQIARELIAKDIPLSVVAEKTGFGNIRYLRELFKKYYGVNIHQFKMISNEITLYHQKPWDVEALESDIIKNK